MFNQLNKKGMVNMKRKLLVMAAVVACMVMLLGFNTLANDISVYVDNEYLLWMAKLLIK